MVTVCDTNISVTLAAAFAAKWIIIRISRCTSMVRPYCYNSSI